METIPNLTPSAHLQSLVYYPRTKIIRFSQPILHHPSLSYSSISVAPFSFRKFLSLHRRRPPCVAQSRSDHHHHSDHTHHDDDHHHSDHTHHDHHGHHHHHHHQLHDKDRSNLTGPQRAILGFAKATRWIDLADFLREHLQLCCCSTALFVAAAICPHVLPKPVIKPIQNALILIAFPLVGVYYRLPL